MAMNLWECEQPGCRSQAVGSGTALGLRAIGWYVKIGGPAPEIFCPRHRPDPMPCIEQGVNLGNACSECAGEAQARNLQGLIVAELLGR